MPGFAAVEARIRTGGDRSAVTAACIDALRFHARGAQVQQLRAQTAHLEFSLFARQPLTARIAPRQVKDAAIYNLQETKAIHGPKRRVVRGDSTETDDAP